MNTLDITKLTDTEVKALAYEQLVARNQAQNNINVCEEELAKRAQSKTEVEEEVEEEPKEATE